MNRAIRKRNEEETARAVVSWLSTLGWDVYQEVQIFGHGHVADIVAVNPNVLWILEVKCSLSLKLLEQIDGWLGYAQYRSIASPSVGGRFTYRLLEHFGIGLLRTNSWSDSVDEIVKPRLDRHATFAKRMRKSLCDEHKTFAPAGNSSGSRFSPFQRTCMRVRKAVEEDPGLTLKALVDRVETHYVSSATARSSLAHWIREGKVDGVRIEEGRPLRLFPKEG